MNLNHAESRVPKPRSNVGRLRVGTLSRLSRSLGVIHPVGDVGAGLARIACNGTTIKTYPVEAENIFYKRRDEKQLADSWEVLQTP